MIWAGVGPERGAWAGVLGTNRNMGVGRSVKMGRSVGYGQECGVRYGQERWVRAEIWMLAGVLK